MLRTTLVDFAGRRRTGEGLDTSTVTTGVVVDDTVTVVVQTVTLFLGRLVDDVLEGVGQRCRTIRCIELETATCVALLAVGLTGTGEVGETIFTRLAKTGTEANNIGLDLAFLTILVLHAVDALHLVDTGATTFARITIGDEQDSGLTIRHRIFAQRIVEVVLRGCECVGVVGTTTCTSSLQQGHDSRRIPIDGR